MDRQTLRDWVIRFNEQGPDGLINIPSPGAPPKQTGRFNYISRYIELFRAATDFVARSAR
jgi:hypothetical protein